MHRHQDSSRRNQGRLVTALILTTTLLVVEVVAGFLTNSLALLADAGHMLTDVAGLAMTLFAARFAARAATPGRTYGFYRAEILAALANGVLLLGVAGFVLFEAVDRFRNPPDVASGWMLIVAVVGFIVNLTSVSLLRRGSGEGLNLRAAYFEVLADMVSSLGVIAAAATIWLTGWRYADPIVSTGISLFIVPRTWLLLREAVGVLLEGTPSEINIAALRDTISGVNGVRDVHDLHVWSLTSGRHAMSAHVVYAGAAPSDELLTRVHERVRAGFPIGHVTVQLEPEGWNCSETHL